MKALDGNYNILFFYGGEVIDMQGPISMKNFDFILDLIDKYIDLVESVDKEIKR